MGSNEYWNGECYMTIARNSEVTQYIRIDSKNNLPDVSVQ